MLLRLLLCLGEHMAALMAANLHKHTHTASAWSWHRQHLYRLDKPAASLLEGKQHQPLLPTTRHVCVLL